MYFRAVGRQGGSGKYYWGVAQPTMSATVDKWVHRHGALLTVGAKKELHEWAYQI